VSAALTISAGDTDSRAGASDYLETLVESSLVYLETLHTSAHLDRLASVVLVRPVLEFDILEVVCPKTESTRSSALSIEVMASVAYMIVSIDSHVKDKANIRITRRMLFSLANLIPAVMSEGPSTLIE
jgi:hypothetical protein